MPDLNIKYPRVQLANNVTPSYNGILAANNAKAVLAIQFRAAALTSSSSYYLFGNTDNGTSIRVRVVSSDVIRINLGSVAGGPITGNWDSTGTLGRTKTWLLIVAVDMTAGGQGIAARLYDKTAGAHIAFTVPTLNTGSVMDFSATSGTTAERSLNSGTPGASPDIDFVWLKTGVWLDPYALTTPNLFAASEIGANGEGVFGTLPEIFEVGNAAAWNATAGLNLGTAGKLKMPGGQIAIDVDNNPWPPLLAMQSEVLTAGPYTVDEPIDFLITTNGTNRELTITPNSTGPGIWSDTSKLVPSNSNGTTFTFTPSVAGDYTFTFNNDVSYVSPVADILTIAPVTIVYNTLPTGEPVTLTATQWRAMKLRTSDNELVDDLGPVIIRYKDGPSETGVTNEVAVSYDVIQTIYSQTKTVLPSANTPIDLSMFTDLNVDSDITVLIPVNFNVSLIYPTELEAFVSLTKGVPTTVTYIQLISILQQLGATPNGLLNGSIKFSYPKNDGSRLTKIINTSYIVEAHDTVDNINVSITPTEVINLNIHTSNYSIPAGNQVTVTNVAENPLEIRYIA